MPPKDDLTNAAANRDRLARISDQADQAIKTWETVFTDFLSPPEQIEAQAMLERLTDVHSVAWGGYPQAERQRLAIARTDIPLDPSQIPLSLLTIDGNFMFDPANHGDFLGALLSTGLERSKVGDIIVLGERGAQAIAVPELADFLTQSLTQVRSVPVKTQPLGWEQLRVRPPQKKDLTTVEASLRLDAIASAGFGMSRSKMADLISSGDVRVNWNPVSQPSHTLNSGDLVAIRGKGRLEIGDIAVTKKERYRINLTRYQ
ncbi:photosystem II S4 domain protein [Leptolyngbya sp. KIOST-1]|uniref:photosystem II S4 domain protein n=1 Tax=Leptolyngbya sp. KIOST-1 TaxID=1229172 RepID=UPI00055C6823|nr:photosystem II S4 domain protein [Leptolyngbya sp. KIOST-1]